MSETHSAGRPENPQGADPPWWSRPGREATEDPFASPPHGADTAQLPSAAYGASAAGQGAEWVFAGQGPLGQPRLDTPRRRYGAGLLAACVALALLVGGGAGGVAGYFVADRNKSPVHDENASLGSAPAGAVDRPPDSVAGIAARLLPSVVKIDVSGGGQAGSGSGFVIRGDGYILTNNHVAELAGDSGQIDVRFSDNSAAGARVVGADPRSDLAVIKVETGDMPAAAKAVTLGNSDDVQVGDPVVAIGSPLGLSGTVTSGIVSAKNRTVVAGAEQSGQESYINAIQTDAAINPGNSGGPLVNSRAQVIGINSAIATIPGGGLGGTQEGNIGVGFAIPANQARRIAEELIRDGKADRPIIGVSLDVHYDGEGARISGDGEVDGTPVQPDGPASQAGLKPGDVITALDGRPITNSDDLIVAIGAHAPGDRVTLTVKRGNETKEYMLTLGTAPGD
jgi:S1-C subfamily serine protease